MTESGTRYPELLALFIALSDGSISDDDFARLDACLSADAKARSFYLEFTRTAAMLEQRAEHLADADGADGADEGGVDLALLGQELEVAGGWMGGLHDAGQLLAPPEDEASSLVDLTQELRDRRLRSLRAHRAKARRAGRIGQDDEELTGVSKLVVVLAAAAALGLIAWLGWPDTTPTDPTPPAGRLVEGQDDHDTHENARPPAIASIESAVDARWLGLAFDSPVLRAGQAVTLREGLARVVFEDGAAVIVQSPATFETTDANAMRLTSGRITATIPPSAHGFTVQTPGGLITDYGTEFGVHVNHDGQTLAQTFTGRIGLTPLDGGDEVQLLADQAVVADRRGGVREVAAKPLAFVRDEEYGATRDAASDPYARWRAYSYALRRDSDTLVYYTFENIQQPAGVVRNQAVGPDARRWDATHDTQALAPGRFSQKPALRFSLDTDHLAATLDREMQAVTLAGWYWVDEMVGSFASLFHTNGTSGVDDMGGIHWHLNTNHGQGWSIEFVQNRHRTPQQTYWYDALSQGWGPASLTGRWVHFAVCYDSVTGEARLYVDGEQVNRSSIHDGVPIQLDSFRLGNWDVPAQRRLSDGARPLRGRIDEFVVCARAFSGQEVAAMYQAGKPDN